MTQMSNATAGTTTADIATTDIATLAIRQRPLPPVGMPAEVADSGLVRIGAAVGTCPRA